MSLSRLDLLLKEGDFERARREIDGRLKKNPKDREALLGSARLKVFDGELEDAEKLLAKAEKSGGQDPLWRLTKAGLLAQKGDGEGAILLYRSVIQEAPERAEAHFGLGFLLAAEEKYDEARAAFEQAVKLDDSSAVYHLHLARVLFEAEQPRVAVDHLERSLQLNPKDPAAWLILAVVMREVGEPDAAVEALEKGLAFLPKQPDLLTALSNLLVAKGDLARARAAALEVLEQRPNDPAARNNVARFLLAERRFGEALVMCQQLEGAGEATATTYSIAATALESLDEPDWDGAVAAWREAMKLAPDDWKPANDLGNLILRRTQEEGRGSVEEAVEALQEARRRGPDRKEPLLNLALAYVRLGKSGEAKALAKQLVDSDLPKDDDLREQAARLLSKLE